MNRREKRSSVIHAGSKNNFSATSTSRVLRPGGQPATSRIGRREFLKGVGALGLAGVASPFIATAASRPSTPLRHIVVDMQENRSFDHYYGYAPWAGRFGVPNNYAQPDGAGGFVTPYHFNSLSTPDIGHSWSAMHAENDGGAMDGFYTTDGINAMGYYTADDLPFYYSLFESSTLCANYFCSLMGPTWPNRFYLAAGTSGGITTNGVWGYGRCPRMISTPAVRARSMP